MPTAKVLIVEDEAIIAEDIRHRLNRLGFETIGPVDTGKAAIAEAERCLPDLVLMDIHLRGKLNGIEAAGEIRTRFKTPVVYLSAHTDQETVKRAKLSEVSGFLTKPFREQELGATIEVALYKHQSELKLAASEAQFRNIFEHSNDAIFAYCFQEDKVIEANPKACRMLGFTREELLSMPISDIHYGEMSGLSSFSQSVRKTGASWSDQFHCRAKDGRLIPVEISASLLDAFQASCPSCMLMLMRNITKRRRAEKEREEMLKKLQEKNRELERFGYIVSHELKSPLFTIQGFLALLAKEISALGDEQLMSDIITVNNAALRMGEMMKGLLQLSRTGRVVNPPEEVSLNNLVNEAQEVVRGSLNEKNVNVEIDAALPIVKVDTLRIREVFVNLIENAVKYMGLQAKPVIEIGARWDGEKRIIFIKDNGIGLDPKFHKNIFDIFKQLNPKADGTGLGLSLVERIIKAHGGCIWVESEGQGHGSTFCFTLPIIH